jgi:hypothetical protein
MDYPKSQSIQLGQPDISVGEWRTIEAQQQVDRANTEDGKIKQFANWAWKNKSAGLAVVTGVWNYLFPGKDLAQTVQQTAQKTVGRSVQDNLQQAGISLDDAVQSDLDAIARKDSGGLVPIALAALAIGVLFGGRR